MSMVLLQVTRSGAWWMSGWLWLFIALLVIAAFGLLHWTWYSPRRR
ncbi:MAG TPA: hypothetical protein VLU41_01705 [Ideonella sp.]|nr:hypothetical protein [Ideonella sp.]